MRWYNVRNRIKEEFGQRPDINAMLFIIGINEVGIVKETWEKEEKQDLMHVAVCKLLSSEGYYRFVETDEEGWPHYEAIKSLPPFDMKAQEELLKNKIVEYFEAL
ncbi:MAG: hypothetical protein IPP77_04420 [Bacteroidetes bacterium]|nr:hypothetical protein [Bacteroidota bacterium]